MPFDHSAIPRRLLEAARERSLVPLVGSGVSKQASSEFPNWRELLLRLRDKAISEQYLTAQDGQEIDGLIGRGHFLMAAQHLKYAIPPDEYHSILEMNFKPKGVEPSEVHRKLVRLQPYVMLTTNYDRLLEDAFAVEYQKAPTVYTYKDPVVVQRFMQGRRQDDTTIIFKIHGTIDDPDSVILSEYDYRQLLYRNLGYRLVLSSIFLTQVVLFIGFSFSDPELRLLLESHREALKHRNSPDYMFLSEDSAGLVERRRIREDFGVQMIPYTPSPNHEELPKFVECLLNKGKDN